MMKFFLLSIVFFSSLFCCNGQCSISIDYNHYWVTGCEDGYYPKISIQALLTQEVEKADVEYGFSESDDEKSLVPITTDSISNTDFLNLLVGGDTITTNNYVYIKIKNVVVDGVLCLEEAVYFLKYEQQFAPVLTFESATQTNLCNNQPATVVTTHDYLTDLSIVGEFEMYGYNITIERPKVFQVFTPGNYKLIGQRGIGLCNAYVEFVIEDESSCGRIQGTVYLDKDKDCKYDSALGDVLIKNSKVIINNGEYLTYTDEKGKYYFNLPYGSYTVSIENSNEEVVCKNDTLLTLSQDKPLASYGFAIQMDDYHETKVTVSSSRARPDREMVYTINYDNFGTFDEQVTIKLGVDPLLDFVSAIPNNFTQEGDSLLWSVNKLKANDDGYIKITYKVPADVGLTGTELHSTATISSGNEELFPENNRNSARTRIVNSYDPNDITLLNSNRTNLSDIYLDEDEWLNYRIRFQNKGTAEAFDVVVRDTLPNEMDITSLVVEGASHDYVTSIVDNNVLTFTFKDINLPDDKTDELGSHGWVKYHIKQASDNILGDVIRNQADIYFDINPEVVTNETINIIGEKKDETTGILHDEIEELNIYPNPLTDVLYLSYPIKGDYFVQVFNTSGGLIESFTFVDKVKVSTAQWGKGVFYITIRNKESVITKKVIK